MKVFQIGSSIDNPEEASDLDLIIVSDKPVDICVYTEQQWLQFEENGGSSDGRRIVIHPQSWKGDKLNGNIKQVI